MIQFETHRWTYEQLNQRQIEIYERLQTHAHASPVVLLSELDPVITYGRRTNLKTDLHFDPKLYEKRKIALLPVSRGGFATYHGPGQWVLFPVGRLSDWVGDSKGVRKFVGRLLEVAQRTARAFGKRAEIKFGEHLGLWSSRGKIASVGIEVRNGVVLHGLSLNGYLTPEAFWGLRPCGIDAAVDQVLTKPSNFKDLGEELELQFRRSFERLTGEPVNVIEKSSLVIKSVGA